MVDVNKYASLQLERDPPFNPRHFAVWVTFWNKI